MASQVGPASNVNMPGSSYKSRFERLLAYFRRDPAGHARRVDVREALALIAQHNLATVRDSWHYSWNLEYFYEELHVYERGDRLYVFHDTPINEWSPAPLFSNDINIDMVIAKKGKNCPFWFLKLATFDAFLDRRTAISRRPRRNFPTRQSYPRVKRRLRCRLESFPLIENSDLFVNWYDLLKDAKYHHSGAKCFADAIKNNFRAPRDWFKFYALIEEGSEACKCVSLVIEDGRSCSGINIASERRNSGGYGVLLDVEVVRTLCERRYYSYDSGISRRYGNSKDVIFLDVLPVDSSGQMPFLAQAHRPHRSLVNAAPLKCAGRPPSRE